MNFHLWIINQEVWGSLEGPVGGLGDKVLQKLKQFADIFLQILTAVFAQFTSDF